MGACHCNPLGGSLQVVEGAGRAQAKTDLDSALQWCKQQKSAEVRARALLGIAEGVLDRRQKDIKAK
jgi:hypothetical protein